MAKLVQSLHARIDSHPALTAMADLNSRVERKLHAETEKGRKWTGDLAVSFYDRFCISAKNLEHIYRAYKGKVTAVVEAAKARLEVVDAKIASKKSTISRAERKLAKATKTIVRELGIKRGPNEAKLNQARKDRKKLKASLHQHRRRLGILELQRQETERQIDHPTLCFGSRDLFNAQHHLAENGYVDRAAWLRDWQDKRSSQFFVEGDAARGGNAFVKLEARKDGLFDVEVRLPKALTHLAERTYRSGGKDVACIDLRGVVFPYGADVLRRAVEESRPLSFRFQRDGESWRLFVMLAQDFGEAAVSSFRDGALGVDLNADHVAATLVSPDGNPLQTWRIPLVTVGRTADQRQDAVRQAAAAVAKIAVEYQVPVVAESLDFSKKKAELEACKGRRYARMLSSFAYSQFNTSLERACVRHRVHLVRVNPAYTSLIGAVKFARRYGLSVHAAAALSIARRGMGMSEGLPPTPELTLGSGDHVTLERPVRNARRHVWSSWRELARGRNAVLAERARTRHEARSRHPSQPLHREGRDAGTGFAPSGAGRWKSSLEDVGLAA